MSLVTIIMLLIGVETDYRSNPQPGDNGDAVGCLQIHPIMIKEANRLIDGEDRFSLSDRHDKVKSMQIASIFLSYQIKRYRHLHNEEPSALRIMQSWNTGSIFVSAPTRYRQRINMYLDMYDNDKCNVERLFRKSLESELAAL